MGETFKIIPTEDPSTVSFMVKVSTQELRPEMMPSVGTAYRDIKLGERKRVNEGWGEYQYAAMTSTDDGFVNFIFVKPPQNTDNPSDIKPFRSWASYEDGIDWPPVLEALPNGKIIEFTEDNAFPYVKQSSFNGVESSVPRVLVRYSLRPRFTGKTLVRTSLYLGSDKWDAKRLEMLQPMPGPVRWNHVNTSEDLTARYGPLLHGDIQIPAFGGVRTWTENSTNPVDTPPQTVGEILPATNFTTWKPYRVAAKQDFVDGLWRKTISVAYPPPRKLLTEVLM